MLITQPVRLIVAGTIGLVLVFSVTAEAQSSRRKSTANRNRPSTTRTAPRANTSSRTNATHSSAIRNFSGQGRYGYNGATVAGGTFAPGFGVNNGFAGFQPNYGGLYSPGFGVNNGFPRPQQNFGGMYVPGYGVNNGFPRPQQNFGGVYIPGQGVNNGFPSGTAVKGGTYIPGFGVTGK